MKAEIAQEIANFKGHFLWKREKAKQIAAQVLNDPAATENEKALAGCILHLMGGGK